MKSTFLAVFLITNRAEIDEGPRLESSAMLSEIVDNESNGFDAPPRSLDDIMGDLNVKEEENPFDSDSDSDNPFGSDDDDEEDESNPFGDKERDKSSFKF